MIAPDMATMLSYVFTDAPSRSGALQAMLSKSVERSFNAITVDSDTSTSDTLMIFATGAAKRGAAIEDAADPRAAAFRRALDKLLRNPRATGGARRRRRAQVHRGQRRRRGDPQGGQAHRDLDRQFAACQDRVARRRRQLGPRGDGGRQGGREGRARQARHLFRQDPRRPPGPARSRPTTKRRPRPI